jgi:hypothetical protein
LYPRVWVIALETVRDARAARRRAAMVRRTCGAGGVDASSARMEKDPRRPVLAATLHVFDARERDRNLASR